MCIEWNDDWLIKDNYEHQNSNSMNEYRGFKVGDKVEVIDPCSSSKNKKGDIGIIKEMQIGSLMEYGKCVVILVVPEGASDVARWEHFSAIKKIPKYSAGDVVRRMGVISVVVKYEETPPYYLVDGADGKDSNWSLMSELTDFDGFRVGDTVWTVKRGKGKVVSEIYCCTDGRSFFVRFDNDTCDRNPRDRNLIPTEAKYKEALNKTGYAFKIDVAVVEEYDPKDSVAKHFEKIEKAAQAMNLIHSAAKIWANAFGRTTDQIKFPSGGVVFSGGTGVRGEYCEPFTSKKLTFTRSTEGKLEVVDDGVEKKYRCSKFAVHELVSYAGCIRAVVDKIHYKDGKFTYDLRTNSCSEGLPEDSLSAVVAHSAKFKVGDSVYYKGVKTTIRALWRIEPHEFMYVIHPNSYECAVPESDLRLWVETKFSYILGSGVCIIPMSQIDMKSIKYMGKSVVPPANIEYGDDVFLGKTTSGKDIILFGTNGDDIS